MVIAEAIVIISATVTPTAITANMAAILAVGPEITKQAIDRGQFYATIPGLSRIEGRNAGESMVVIGPGHLGNGDRSCIFYLLPPDGKRIWSTAALVGPLDSGWLFDERRVPTVTVGRVPLDE